MNMSPDNSHSTGRHWSYLVVALLMVMTFPGDFHAITPGLDASWGYALNHLTQTNYIFGRDFAHPYGPLGYLLNPLDIGSNLIQATIFRLTIHGIFTVCLLYCAHRAKGTLPIISFAIGYALSMVVVTTLEFSYHLLVVESLLFCISMMDRRLIWVAAPLCGALASATLFMKFGIGIAAAAILTMASAMWLLTMKGDSWKALLLSWGAYLILTASLAAFYLKSPDVFPAWVARSLIMSDAFVVAQSIVGSRKWLLLGLMALATYAWMVYSLHRQRSPLRYIAPVFALALFLAFKHGFVRQDGHERNFFPFLLASISVVALNMTTRSEFKTVTIAFGLVFASAAPVGIHYSAGWPSVYRTLLGQTGIINILATVGINETRKRLAIESASNLREKSLPSEWISEIRTQHGTVDVIPWELSYVLSSHLSWVPNPTIQIFNSYARSFDQWQARHYTEAESPEYLVVEFLAIDGRHLLLDTPAATRSILSNYELHDEKPAGNIVLLKKRPQMIREGLALVGGRRGRSDTWIDVPRSDNLLFASTALSLSTFGRFAKVFFRIPPVFLDVVYESGREASFRVTPEVAEDGLLINYLPADQADFSALLKGCAKDRAARIRFSGPGTFYYGGDITLQWSESFSPRQMSQQFACGG